MTSFKLLQKSTNKPLAKFHVIAQNGDIVGSVAVAPKEVADLLRHWTGPVEGPKQQHAPLGARKGVSAMVAAMTRKPRTAMSQAAILRGCE